MLFYFDRFIETWLLPPGLNLLLVLLGLIVWRSWPLVGKSLLILSLFSLWMLSTPIIAQRLLNGLQYLYPALLPEQLKTDKNSAIVVLEASLNLHTPEYGKPTVSDVTLTRIRYAAFLHEKTGIPVMVSGNDPTHPLINQADYMADALESYFHVPTQWKEAKGYNTAQEGILATEILKKAGITKIYLVTHASHMPRAVYAFQHRGIDIIPAPTGYKVFTNNKTKASDFYPTIESLSVSAASLREYIGMLWYRLYYPKFG